MQPDIIAVEFKGRRTELATNPLQFPFEPGDPVIVEVERGHDLGYVVLPAAAPAPEGESAPVITVIRKAAPGDLKAVEANHERESEARQIAVRKIQDHHLEMKLVDVELQWDGRKMTFYFTAEGRVDFRELVKDLASTFRTRIDLRQIGARDETKRTGGYGVCGESLCCACFLTEFKPITTQMPRDQFLPLNPSKLSGVCGRLKCCLRYELDTYREFQKSCPKIGHPVRDAAKGEGSIEKLDLMRDQIHVRYMNGEIERFDAQEFIQITNWRPEMPKNECICTVNRKAPATQPTTTVLEKPIATGAESKSGERVTLLAGGGLGMQSSSGGADIHVGTSLELASSKDPAKKKRKRRRGKKKPAAPGAPQTENNSSQDEGDSDDES